MKKKSKYESGHPCRLPYTGLVDKHSTYKGEICSKCGKGEIVEFDGGDQGDTSFEYCENDKCSYIKH